MTTKLDLFRRVQEVLDSPHRDEFIRRFRKIYKLYHKPEWKELEKQFVEQWLEEDVEAQRAVSIKPLSDEMFLNKGCNETRKEIKQFGPISFEFKEDIELKKKRDYMDELLDDLRDADAFYLVTYAEAPERIVKKFIYSKVARPFIDSLELLVGGTVDNITGREEFSLSKDVHTINDIKTAKERKTRQAKVIKRDITILKKRLKSTKVQNDIYLLKKTQNELDELEKSHINWKKVFDVFVRNPVKQLLEW